MIRRSKAVAVGQLWMILLALLMAVGCRTIGNKTDQDDYESQLKAIRDTHYVLRLETNRKGDYMFVTCQPDYRLMKSGCVNAFTDQNKKGIIFNKEILDHYRNGIKIVGSKEQKKLTSHLFMIGAGGKAKATVMGIGAVGGALLTLKIGSVVVPVAILLGFGSVTAVGFYSVEQWKKEVAKESEGKDVDIKGLQRQIEETAMKASAFIANQASNAGKAAVDSSGTIFTESIKGLHTTLTEDKAKFSMVFWGQAERTLGDDFHQIISGNVENKPVSARIPDLLPLLSSLITDLDWVEEDQIQHMCLPTTKTTRTGFQSVQSVCIPMTTAWKTGGPFRYVKPTN